MKTLNFIWIGPSDPPRGYDDFRNAWRRLHPELEHRVWGEAELAAIGLDDDPTYRAAYKFNLGSASDYARLCILREHGGVYTDVDIEPKKRFDPVLSRLADHDVVIGREPQRGWSGRHDQFGLNNGWIAANPDAPAIHRAIAEAQRRMVNDPPLEPWDTLRVTGPIMVSEMWWDDPTVYKFAVHLLNDPASASSRALGQHHYANSWLTNETMGSESDAPA